MPDFLRVFARLALWGQFKAIRKACQNATGLIGITTAFLQWGLNYAERSRNKYDAVYPLAYIDTTPKINADEIKEAKLFWQEKGLNVQEGDFIISFV